MYIVHRLNSTPFSICICMYCLLSIGVDDERTARHKAPRVYLLMGFSFAIVSSENFTESENWPARMQIVGLHLFSIGKYVISWRKSNKFWLHWIGREAPTDSRCSEWEDEGNVTRRQIIGINFETSKRIQCKMGKRIFRRIHRRAAISMGFLESKNARNLKWKWKGVCLHEWTIQRIFAVHNRIVLQKNSLLLHNGRHVQE